MPASMDLHSRDLAENSRSGLLDLPPELMNPILSQLELLAFIALKHTCRSFYYSLGTSMPEDELSRERLRFNFLKLVENDPFLNGQGVCYLCKRAHPEICFPPSIFSERVCGGCAGSVEIMIGLRINFSQFNKFRLFQILEQLGKFSDPRWSTLGPRKLEGLNMRWQMEMGMDKVRLSFQEPDLVTSSGSIWSSWSCFFRSSRSPGLFSHLKDMVLAPRNDPLHLRSMRLARSHQEYLDIGSNYVKLSVEENGNTTLYVGYNIRWTPSNRDIPDNEAYRAAEPIADKEVPKHRAPCMCPHIWLDGSRLPPASSRWRNHVHNEADADPTENLYCRICNTLIIVKDLTSRFYNRKRFLGGRVMSLEVVRNLGDGQRASDPAWMLQLDLGGPPSNGEIIRTKYLLFICQPGSIDQSREFRSQVDETEAAF